MTWKCSACGNEISDDESRCDICGFAEVSALVLTCSDGQCLELNITTTIGRPTFSSDDDGQFLDDDQFTLQRNDENEWLIVPADRTTNETLLNDRAVTAEVVLQEGDVIAVGREEKGIVKLPLTVSFVR